MKDKPPWEGKPPWDPTGWGKAIRAYDRWTASLSQRIRDIPTAQPVIRWIESLSRHIRRTPKWVYVPLVVVVFFVASFLASSPFGITGTLRAIRSGNVRLSSSAGCRDLGKRKAEEAHTRVRTRFWAPFQEEVSSGSPGVCFLVTDSDVSTGRPSAAATQFGARLAREVTPENILEHLNEFQEIADQTGGTRAANTLGHLQSAEYVEQQLEDAGYVVERLEFDFPAFKELSPTRVEEVSPTHKEFRRGKDFDIMLHSAAGDVRAGLVPVGGKANGPPASGCTLDDFDGFPRGQIALVRGECVYQDQAENAENAGASAILVTGQVALGERSRLSGENKVGIPVIKISEDMSERLLRESRKSPLLHLRADTVRETRQTSNVIAETSSGNDARVVLVGAYLDSDRGPGINANGSGAATVLEIARQIAKLEPENKVRFAFWSAEADQDSGTWGSWNYGRSLTSQEYGSIVAYLDFQSLGSPNYGRFVYQASEGAPESDSERIQELFEDYFSQHGLQTKRIAPRYTAEQFTTFEIPAGGLFGGDGARKTFDDAFEFGGVAEKPYDACFRRPCDDIDHINKRALRELADAAAYVTGVLAEDSLNVLRERGGAAPGQ